MRGARAQQRRAALTEQVRVMQLVDRVREIQPPQQRIGRELRGPEDVASAVAFDLAERDQLSNASIEVAPHPLMKGTQHAIDEGSRRRHRNRAG